jgi:prepilin-type N-terminal cleavage/methylation domain-containing protein
MNCEDYSNKQKGFTFIELLVTISIVSIITLITAKYKLTDTHNTIYNNQINKTVETMQKVGSAASNFASDNSNWPDEINNCADTVSKLSSATPTAYLNFIDTNITLAFSCTTMTFTTSATMIDDFAAKVASNQLANSTATASVVKTTIPRPEHISALTKFLLLDGSRAMTGDLDMDGNAIKDVLDIALSDGRKLSSAFIDTYIIDMNASPREFVPKPTCVAPQVADIFLSLGSFSASNNKAIFSILPTVDIPNSNSTRWAIKLFLFTEDGATTSGSNTFVKATTYCK